MSVRFAGYAAIFDQPDSGGDVVRRGAFEKALARAEEVPLLWQHKAGAVIGRIEHLSEDTRGLRVIGSVGDARMAALLNSAKLKGLSFGYRVRAAKSAGSHRELIELDLVEVSLVAKPMQRLARVHAVEKTDNRLAAEPSLQVGLEPPTTNSTVSCSCNTAPLGGRFIVG